MKNAPSIIDKQSQFDVLCRFIEESAPSQDELDDLFQSPTDRYVALSTYFILGSPDNEVELFLHANLNRLLAQLATHTTRHREESQERIRGRIDWPQTHKARVTAGWKTNVFVCQRVKRHFDRPENRVLRHLLNIIAMCLEHVPDGIRHGVSYLGRGTPTATFTRLQNMEAIVSVARKHIFITQATSKPVSDADLHALEASRAEGYDIVERLYRRYLDAVAAESWLPLFDQSRGRLLLPANLGAEQNRWIRLALAVGSKTK